MNILIFLSSIALFAGAILGSAVFPRRNVNDIMNNPVYVRQRDLLTLSLKAILEMNASDPLSFHMIASIHGAGAHPYRGAENNTSPFNNSTAAKNGDRWMGYCEHNDVLFPTWHRPYVLLLEKSITSTASKIAQLYPSGPTRSAYVKAAQELRWPYWDWAATPVVPAFLLLTKITVNAPVNARGTLVPLPGSIGYQPNINATSNLVRNLSFKNPFYSYVFKQNTAPPFPNTKFYQDSGYGSFPYNNPIGSETVRWPDEKNRTNNTQLGSAFMLPDTSTSPYDNHQPFNRMVIDLLQIQNWDCFSNRKSQLKDEKLCIYQSLESIHNWVHNNIGGYAPFGAANGGQMSNLESASFDPVFFLHHCNVDRLLALYQAFRPGVYVTDGISDMGGYMYDKGQPLSITSPLYPFRVNPLSSDETSRMYTSIDVASTSKLGYVYDDLDESVDYIDLYAKITTKYGGIVKGFRWWLYDVCTSVDPIARANEDMKINISYSPTGSPNVSIPLYYSAIPRLIKQPMVNLTIINVTFAYELTTFMQANNVATNVYPIDGDYSKGPQFFPIYTQNFASSCYVPLNNGTNVPVRCQCFQRVLWSVDGPLDAPYDTYRGFAPLCKGPLCG